VEAVNTTGNEAKPQGGDTRSHRIEAFSTVILAAVAARKDISLAELAEMLRTEHGAGTARRRSAWFAAQPDLDPRRLVFIDEPAPRPRWPGCGAVP
jgi:hypothetical protein